MFGAARLKAREDTAYIIGLVTVCMYAVVRISLKNGPFNVSLLTREMNQCTLTFMYSIGLM